MCDGLWRRQIVDLEGGVLQATSQLYAAIIRRCANARDLAHGGRVHRHLIAAGYGRHLFLGNLLVQMYSKCGNLELARRVFHTLPVKNEFSCSMLISAYLRAARPADAIALFREMPLLGIRPDGFVYASVLSACSSVGDLEQGISVHDEVKASQFIDDPIVQTALVDFYAKCGRLEEAGMVFETIGRDRDVFSWTALASGYAQHGQPGRAIQIFHRMDLEGVGPDAFTFSSILGACSSTRNHRLGRLIHSRVEFLGMDREDAVMQCSIIKMYGKCGSVGNARAFFDRIASPSVWCWTTMIGAYAQNGHMVEAMEMFHRMVLEGVRPVESTFVLVLSACTTLDHAEAIHARVLEAGSQGENLDAAFVGLYAGFGRIDQATRTFERMSTKKAECWGCLIAAMAKEGDKARALELYQEWWFKKNDSELSKSASIFAAALSACSSVDEVQEIESHIRAFSAKSSLSKEVGAALVTFFARWGSVDDSSRVFESLELRDTVTWNAMLGAYVQFGHSRAAIGFYYRMNLEGIFADSFTFCSILGSCSDLCDLELGKRVHQRAVSIGQANLVVKNALLRMYARCARLDYARRVFEEVVGARDSGSWTSMISGYVQAGCPREALELFHRMDVEPSVATYGSVLEACSSLGELDQAKAVHGRFVSAGLESEVVDTTLVKMLAGAGFVGDARRVFESCKSSRKDPVSWNAMIAAYAQHGDMAEVTNLYRRMNLEGCSSGTVTFVSILIGCSRAGLLEESIYQFGSMSSDHWIRPVVEHFVCVVDLLGRAGRLDEAEELVETMPVESRLKFGAWKSLLAGCKIHRTSEEALRRIESRSKASCGDERLVLGTLWRSL